MSLKMLCTTPPPPPPSLAPNCLGDDMNVLGDEWEQVARPGAVPSVVMLGTLGVRTTG
jgi:hypothetical protein